MAKPSEHVISGALILAVFASVLLQMGCSSAGPRTSAEKRVPVHDGSRRAHGAWRQVCFRMPFDENDKPRWAMDLLLAHRVVGPLLGAHAGDIELWRFHRRAAHDGGGHRFSLIFYSDRPTAEALYRGIRDSRLVDALIREHYLSEVMESCGAHDGDEALAATSDKQWDSRLQKTWPYFIMGVSAHWLALIEEVGREVPEASERPDELLERYERIRGEIREIWQVQGQHAYLHHLNALFGYQPLVIKNYMQF